MEDTAQSAIQLPEEALEAVKIGIDYSANREWIPRSMGRRSARRRSAS